MLLTDLRHALRLLWKSRGITATTLLTLALGIGATTAIFSSVYSLMLKPLPYQEPERIVELWTFFYGLAGDKDSVVRLPGVRATAEMFTILRIQPVIGTFFTKEQNRPGADK